MRGRLVSWALVLLTALVLGTGGADGRALATTTLSVQVTGGGQVTDSGGQISCGAGGMSCYATYVTGSSVTLTATDQGSWTFDSWSGCPTAPEDDECTVNLDGSDHDVTAVFAPTGSARGTSQLAVNVTGDSDDKGGKVSGGDIDCDPGETNCTADVYTGSTLTLVEEPDTNYEFKGWGGSCSGTGAICTVAMSSAQTVSATFAKSAETRTLSVTVTGNGTVTGGGIACTSSAGSGCTADETADSTVVLSATPGLSAGFSGWGGACAGTSPTCSVTMDAAKSVSASFTGATGSTFPLSVAVTGDGRVTGVGLDCRAGGGTCSSNAAAGSAVTLTATPASGGTFEGWGGACTGTSSTCTVTMTSAKSATADFSQGEGGGPTLRVTVTGPGTVTGGGINCGNGASACSADEDSGADVTLTAAPAAGVRFTGWGGACSGTAATCTVQMDASRTVSASFGTASTAARASSIGLQSRGRPVVTRTRSGFMVTLRFRTGQRGQVHVRALRAGRLETALSFAAPVGVVAVGPFPVAKPGFYALDVTQGRRALHWHACLGRCGEAAARRAGPFALGRSAPTVVDAGALWSVTLHFRSTQPAGADLRVYRSKKLAREVRFAGHKGRENVGPLLLSPGTYTMRLNATDAYGRVRMLTWVAFLP